MTRGGTGVGDLLAALLSPPAGHDPSSCAERLAAADPVALIAAALDAGPAMELFTTDSYRHSNGFDKISFPAVPGTEARLRLHIWPAAAHHPGGVAELDTTGLRSAENPADVELGDNSGDGGGGDKSAGGGDGEPDVHDHRWAFVSRILVGAIVNETYDAAADPAGRYRHYRHTQAGPRSHRLTFVGRADLRPTGAARWERGQTYAMGPDVLHRVVPAGGGIAATAVVELEPIRDVTQVYASSGGPETDSMVRLPRFPADAVLAKLRALHALMIT